MDKWSRTQWITYLFPNFNGCTIEACESIRDSTLYDVYICVSFSMLGLKLIRVHKGSPADKTICIDLYASLWHRLGLHTKLTGNICMYTSPYTENELIRLQWRTIQVKSPKVTGYQRNEYIDVLDINKFATKSAIWIVQRALTHWGRDKTVAILQTVCLK